MSPELLANLITTCIEGGSNYWLTCAQSVSSIARCTQPWYTDPAFYTSGFAMHMDTEDDTNLGFNQESVNQGWTLIETLYPDRAARIYEDDGQWDADDADVFLQLCLYDEIVYG